MMKVTATLYFSFLVSLLGLGVLAQDDVIEATKLESAKIKWGALKNQLGPLDYKYGLADASSRTELSTSYIVLVEQDEVTKVEPFFWTERQPDLSTFMTVDELFDLIDTNIESGSSLITSYDSTYGYPSEVTIINSDTGIHVIYVLDPMTIYTIAQAELDISMAVWNKTSSEDYDYTIRVSCFCIPAATLPKRIEVRGGEIDSIFDLESGVETENFFFNTLEAQFKEIQDVINDRWYILSISYNDTFGYPTRVFFDVHPGMFDDQRTTVISDVVFGGIALVDREASTTPTAAPSSLVAGNFTEYGIEDASSLTTSPTITAAPPTSSDSHRNNSGKAMIIFTALTCMASLLSESVKK